jgi:5-methylcytosine-specific restriction enzyme A
MSRKFWAHYYKSQAWRARRAHQLALQPLCDRCGGVAVVAHHRIPHRGDWIAFIQGELQSLCAPCHNGPAQQREKRGYETSVGLDGWPVDTAHPVNRKK